jgi:hypothetical protein
MPDIAVAPSVPKSVPNFSAALGERKQRRAVEGERNAPQNWDFSDDSGRSRTGGIDSSPDTLSASLPKAGYSPGELGGNLAQQQQRFLI